MKRIYFQLVFCVVFAMLFVTMPVVAEENKPAFEPIETAIVLFGMKAHTIKVDLNGADDIYLVATYGNDSYDSDQAIWADPTLYDHEGNAVRLTTLKPESARVGWGNLLISENHQGRTLSIGGETFEFGFWAHAPSILHFKLGGKYARFETKIGLDTGSQRGTAAFQVRCDPVAYPSHEEFTSGMRPQTPPVPKVPDVSETKMHFNHDAAQKLIDRGVKELLFIRRLTFDGNHIYTEYVNSRWMPGGGLCALNLQTGKVREIASELTKTGVVGWFDLSFDAKKIVFDFKSGPNDGYRIYEINADGSGLRQLTFPQDDEEELKKKYRLGYHHGTDDMEPCYLPDGGIAFATTRCQFSVLCDSSDNFTVKNLYRINADGGEMRPLTHSALSEATPTMLSSGRILYHRWEYVDKSAGNAKAIWSMNPDGSGSAEVYGNTISFPETMIQAREMPDDPNKIVMLGASHCCPNNAVGTVIVVDTRKNIRSIDAMQYVTDDVATFHHNGFHFKDANGNWEHHMTGKPGRLFRNPYPMASDLFLVSHKPKGLEWSDPAGYDLSLLNEKGRETLLLKDASVSLWQPFPLVSREKPAVAAAASIDEDLAAQGLARCIVTDIYHGMQNVERGQIKYIRVLEQIPRPWSARKRYGDDSAGTTHAHSAIGSGSLSIKVQHGIVPVEEDGSAHFLVPANRSVYFQALDENLCAVQTERTYVNYMPGETRSCVGCHETPDMVQPSFANALPKSLLRAASMPMPQPAQAEARLVFDYDRQVQPIFDKHCVSCHGGEQQAAQQPELDLRGTAANTYSVSYNALVALSKTEKLILGSRYYRDEDAAMNGIEYIAPYGTGALTSPLGAMILGKTSTTLDDEKLNVYTKQLAESHADLQLSEEEKLTLTNWLDINCQYHPSYWGRLHEKFREDPLYRPDVSFDDVRTRDVPKVVAPE